MYITDQEFKPEYRHTTLGAISDIECAEATSIDPVESCMSIQLIARC